MVFVIDQFGIQIAPQRTAFVGINQTTLYIFVAFVVVNAHEVVALAVSRPITEYPQSRPVVREPQLAVHPCGIYAFKQMLRLAVVSAGGQEQGTVEQCERRVAWSL